MNQGGQSDPNTTEARWFSQSSSLRRGSGSSLALRVLSSRLSTHGFRRRSPCRARATSLDRTPAGRCRKSPAGASVEKGLQTCKSSVTWTGTHPTLSKLESGVNPTKDSGRERHLRKSARRLTGVLTLTCNAWLPWLPVPDYLPVLCFFQEKQAVSKGVLVLTRALTLILLALAAGPAFAEQPPKILNCTQLLAWLAGDVSSSRLSELVRQRGIARVGAGNQLALQEGGAKADLISAIHLSDSEGTSIAAESCPIRLARASQLARKGEYQQAEEIVKDMKAADPDNAALYFALGALRVKQSDLEGAFDEFLTAKDLMPDFPETHSRLAYLFYRSDDPDNAIAEARTALSLNPGNAEAYRCLGMALQANGVSEAAGNAFQKSLARDPDNAETFYDLGITLHEKGDDAGAAEAYRHAIERKANFWEAHNNLAMLLHESRQFEAAIAEFGEAKRLAPGEASIRNNLANTLYDKGDFDRALVEYRQLFDLDPDWSYGHDSVAKILMLKRDYAGAVPEWQRAIRQNPAAADLHRLLGQSLLELHQPSDALRELRIAVELGPDAPLNHHFLGVALFAGQRFYSASREFREAVRLEPTAENHYSLAACLITMGDYDEALVELNVATHLHPAHTIYAERRDELVRLMKSRSRRVEIPSQVEEPDGNGSSK